MGQRHPHLTAQNLDIDTVHLEHMDDVIVGVSFNQPEQKMLCTNVGVA